MEDEEDRLVVIALELFLGVGLVLLKEFRAELDVSGYTKTRVSVHFYSLYSGSRSELASTRMYSRL